MLLGEAWRIRVDSWGEVEAIPGEVEGGFGCVREVEVVVVLGGVVLVKQGVDRVLYLRVDWAG